jgi:4-hydroxy-2-oxoheptanedioate aldolase
MNQARGRVLSGEILFGTFLNTGSPVVAEIVGLSGLDWVVIDLEHGAGDEPAALAQVQALAASGVVVLNRVESGATARIAHALDTGAAGVLVPQIQSVEDAEFAASCCRYSGLRGVAKGNRAWKWGAVAHADLRRADAATICALQIETASALAAADEIAAIDGVDVLFIGPADLGFSLGIDGSPDHPRLLEAATAVASAAADSGKAAGILVENAAQAEIYADLGFTFIGCGSDGGVLRRSTVALATELEAIRDTYVTTAERPELRHQAG